MNCISIYTSLRPILSFTPACLCAAGPLCSLQTICRIQCSFSMESAFSFSFQNLAWCIPPNITLFLFYGRYCDPVHPEAKPKYSSRAETWHYHWPFLQVPVNQARHELQDLCHWRDRIISTRISFCLGREAAQLYSVKYLDFYCRYECKISILLIRLLSREEKQPTWSNMQ